MNQKPTRLKHLCEENPALKEKLTELVLSGPMDSFNSTTGRIEPASKNKWVSRFRHPSAKK